MSDTALNLLPQLLALSAEDREMIAKELFSSLEEDDESEARAFLDMLNRRSAAMDRDPSRCLPARQALDELRNKRP